MGEKTNIEWTDHTVNLWWGCSKVHTGCKNCYAEYLSETRHSNGVWGNDAPRKFIKSAFSNLMKFQRAAAKEGVIKKVFVGSMMDIFEDGKPLNQKLVIGEDGILIGDFSTTCEIRWYLFHLINDNKFPNLFFQFLTKRPENIHRFIPEGWLTDPPSNVIFGVSASDQTTYYQMMASVRTIKRVSDIKFFLSYEPATGPIELAPGDELDWVIMGGESGNKARPMHPDWVHSMWYQCHEKGIPFFFKQWGEWVALDQSETCNGLRNEKFINPGFIRIDTSGKPDPNSTTILYKYGKAKTGHLLDGKSIQQFPKFML